LLSKDKAMAFKCVENSEYIIEIANIRVNAETFLYKVVLSFNLITWDILYELFKLLFFKKKG